MSVLLFDLGLNRWRVKGIHGVSLILVALDVLSSARGIPYFGLCVVGSNFASTGHPLAVLGLFLTRHVSIEGRRFLYVGGLLLFLLRDLALAIHPNCLCRLSA